MPPQGEGALQTWAVGILIYFAKEVMGWPVVFVFSPKQQSDVCFVNPSGICFEIFVPAESLRFFPFFSSMPRTTSLAGLWSD